MTEITGTPPEPVPLPKGHKGGRVPPIPGPRDFGGSEVHPAPLADREQDQFWSEDRGRQKIIESLKGYEQGTPRFEAFCDYVDLLETTRKDSENGIKTAMIEETIRQRKNGVKGYKKEFDSMHYNITGTLWDIISHDVPDIPQLQQEANVKYVERLVDIKIQEIDKRTRSS